jgi:predicted metal-binding membrane protein
MAQDEAARRNDGDFAHLDPGGRAIAALSRRPVGGVFAAIAIMVAIAWAVLGAMAVEFAALAPPGGAGPGGFLVERIPALPIPAALDWFFRLCLAPSDAASGGARFAVLATMWLMMSIAMMLPSAAPMIRTYCEIADTAAVKGEAVVHPIVLVAGYLATWAAASAGFALATIAVGAFMAGEGLGPIRGAAGAVALALAGAYQFTALKEACLEKCRNPFAILFARWSSRPAAVFRLGMEQGLWCLGCCWALMLVMFAVGLMNLFWMALLAVFATVEKLVGGPVPTRAAGAILLVWAAALLLLSI